MLGHVIEQVYLTYMGGTPLVHLSRSRVAGDPEIIASMFTAVQDFMDDSFRSIGVGGVKSMEMGKRHHVAFGRGRHVLLYVVYRGRESNRLERQIQHVVVEMQARYGDDLEGWNGDMAHIAALSSFVEQWFGIHPGPGGSDEGADAPPTTIPSTESIRTPSGAPKS